MKKLLVTGAAAFIGSAVVRQFIAETDVTVVNIDTRTYAGNLDSLARVMRYPRDFFEQIDTWDAKHVTAVFQVHQPHGAMGTVAETNADHSAGDIAEYTETNVPHSHYLPKATRPDLGKPAPGLQGYRGITWLTRHSPTPSGEGLHSEDLDLPKVYA